MKSEKVEMDGFLKKNPCPYCGGVLKREGRVLYSDPAQWEFHCQDCGKTGYVEYVDLSRTKIAFSSWGGFGRGVNK